MFVQMTKNFWRHSFPVVIIILLIAIHNVHAADSKTLVLGMQANPPMMFFDGDSPRGFVYDVTRDFARRNGYDFRYIKGNFFQLLRFLQEGKIDILAPLAYTLERARNISFSSDTLVTTWSHIIMSQDSKFNTLFDLNGRTMGVVRGDFSYGFLKKDADQNGLHVRFVEYSGFEEIVDDVAAGTLDSGFISRFSLQYLIRHRDMSKYLKIIPQSFYPANLYVGVNPGRTKLLMDINQYIRQAKSNPDSVFNQSFQDWFAPISDSRGFVPFRTLLIAFIAVLAVMGFILGFNILLRRRVRMSTIEIQSRQRYFRDLLHSIPVGIVILDSDNRVVEVNLEFEKMFGYHRDVLIGAELDRILLAPETREDTRRFTIRIRGFEREVRESRRLTREGASLVVQIICTPTVLANETPGNIRIYIDHTEKNRMEQEIMKSKQIESLGMLAGGIAHDFNNMLTGITGNISLARRLSEKEELIDILDKAAKAVDKSRDLTRQLITFSKGGYPRKQLTNLGHLLRDALDLSLSGASDIHLVSRIRDDLPELRIDSGQISQVFTNLIINARQAMNDSGTIIIKTDRVTRETDTEYLSAGDYVCILISDTGCGIPPGNLDRIFTPYFTTKSTGNGLGLSISFSIVRKHGGHIQVRSLPKKGSEFSIYLPLPSRNEDSGIRSLPVPADTRILVMDDDPAIRELFDDISHLFHIHIDTCGTERESLEKYSAGLDASLPYHVVFLDLVIPGEPGGDHTLEALQELDPGIRAVAMSGYSEKATFTNPRQHGFSELLAKPFGIDDLASLLHRMLTDPDTGAGPD